MEHNVERTFLSVTVYKTTSIGYEVSPETRHAIPRHHTSVTFDRLKIGHLQVSCKLKFPSRDFTIPKQVERHVVN
jgi:hypothetical protein